MNYIDESSKRIITIHEVRRANPDKSLPDGRDYPDLGYRFIFPTEKPSALLNHIVEEDFPEEVNGKWVQVWKQVELPPAPVEVPQEVTRFQAKIALHHFSMFDAAEEYCTSPGTPLEVREAWLSAQVFRRNSPTIISLKDSPLALTDEQLDEMFIFAFKIEA